MNSQPANQIRTKQKSQLQNSKPIFHPSSLILHPSPFFLHPLTLPSRAKKLLHDLSALFLEHASGNINPVIQKLRIANAKSRFYCSSPLVACSIHQPFHPRLYQSTGTHHTGFNRRINHRVSYPVVTDLAGGCSQRHDFRVCGRILISARSVSGNRENRFTGNDASADRNFAAFPGFMGGGESLAHPMRIRFAFPNCTHDRNIHVKQRKIYYRWRTQTLSSKWLFPKIL